MKKLILLLTLLFTSSVFAALTCKTVNNIELCFNSRVDFVVSKECTEFKCDIFDKKIDSSIFQKETPFGNPTESFCSEIKGSIYPVEVEHLGVKHNIKLCKQNESYVDLGTLYLIYMKKYAK